MARGTLAGMGAKGREKQGGGERERGGKGVLLYAVRPSPLLHTNDVMPGIEQASSPAVGNLSDSSIPKKDKKAAPDAKIMAVSESERRNKPIHGGFPPRPRPPR